MQRIRNISLAWSAVLMVVMAGASHATPSANGATVETRTFNDCPLSNLTVNNNYPNAVTITDEMNALCVGFANLHSWSFSADGGATSAAFNNNSNFTFGADVTISGAGEGEGGLRLSPWYGKFVDGRFMLNVTSGEIACFGGALPFYSFTGNHSVTYTRGTTVRMEVTYRAHDLFSTEPASIQYRLISNGTTYDSPVLPFGIQNTAECDPNGLFGCLNDGRAGGYFQPRANSAASLTADFANPDAASLELRTFNDCPVSTLTTVNNYPAVVSISDAMSSLCVGFANLHSWSFSEDGGTTAAAYHNNSNYRYSADFKAVVVFHVTNPNPVVAGTPCNIRGRVLAIHGRADPVTPKPKMDALEEELTKAKVDWHIVTFGRGVHSFCDPTADNPAATQYDEKLCRTSYMLMRDFFAETL